MAAIRTAVARKARSYAFGADAVSRMARSAIRHGDAAQVTEIAGYRRRSGGIRPTHSRVVVGAARGRDSQANREHGALVRVCACMMAPPKVTERKRDRLKRESGGDVRVWTSIPELPPQR